jgi:predicted DNA-binding protein (UPF0251 family)
MARPTKWRKVENIPNITHFVPSEAENFPDEGNVLKLEELEAVRLKDLLGLEQEECAEKMEVSRPTFQRILISAREKIADSLVHGKSIHIEGGHFTRNLCRVRCLNCGKEWTERLEDFEVADKDGNLCAGCGSAKIACGKPCKGRYCKKGCRMQG